MGKRKILLVAAALIASSAAATPVLPGPPRLLVVISVDQLSGDLFDEYSPHFTGGFARLGRGAVFRNGYQSHATTETCPGHSTILTGNHPAHTGIVANSWIDPSAPRADKKVYCAEDERVPGTSSGKYKVSAVHLNVPTLGEFMKARWPASRNVGVAGKDRAAVMMSGHNPDQRWYWDGKRFATDLERVVPPASVAAANAAIITAIAQPRPALTSPPDCAAKAQPIALNGHASVGIGAFARSAGDVQGFRVSPEYDGATLALAAALVREMKLGQGSAPDILSIGLSATDLIGHYYGTQGQEMCLQMHSLDRDLGDFFAFLDQSQIDYAVALTADHGGEDLPERLRIAGVSQAQRADPALRVSAVGKAVAANLNLPGSVLIGDLGGDVYTAANLGAEERARVLPEAMRIYRAHPQVEKVFTRDEIARAPMPSGPPDRWSLLDRTRAGFDPQRSGDFFVVLKQHVTPLANLSDVVATHGTPWDYDRRVPIIFWRKGFSGSPMARSTDTVDIMPTLAAMLNLSIDRSKVDGTCLPNLVAVTCPR